MKPIKLEQKIEEKTQRFSRKTQVQLTTMTMSHSSYEKRQKLKVVV